MTHPEPNHRDRRERRRELARELANVPAPPPPAGLLDAIRGELPGDLARDAAPAPAQRRARWRAAAVRLAASLAFVTVGTAVVVRLMDRPEPRAVRPAGVSTETRPVLPEASPLEVDEKAIRGNAGEPDDEASKPDDEASKPDDQAPAAPQRRGVSVETGDAASPASPRESSAGSRDGSRDGEESARQAPAFASAAPPAPPTGSAGEEPRDAEARDLRSSALRGAAPQRLQVENQRLPAEDQTAERITVTSEAPVVDKYAVEEVEIGAVSSYTRERSARLDAPMLRMDRIDRIERRPPPSTGGTAEPNDAPVGDMFFRTTGVNPFVDTREDALSTFALEVDTGSWTLARSYLGRGALPPPEAIRVEEFVNAQRYDDPAPRRGDFTLVAEGAPSPFAAPGDYRLLRFAVKGRELVAADRRPAALTFVVDVSGSMAREDRLGLVKQALGMLLDELEREDRVGLVVYGTTGRVVLDHTGDHERIRRAIDALWPEGSTNAADGLRLGYDLAGMAYREGWNNRVVLCSDGVANVGVTGPESILERIGREARRGIELTTVGFGMGNYNDALMEQLADQGDGRYHYVDTLDEARRIFRENLSGTLETIAKDAKVQVELDPGTVERWRLLGYENRDVADRDFRNDRIDAGEIGAGHSATALYEIRLAPRARHSDTVGTLRLRWRSVATGSVEEAALTLRVGDLERSFAGASPNLRRAAVAAELAEILKHSFYAKEASWETLRAEARRLEPLRGSGRRTDDLLAMIEQASATSHQRNEPEE